MKAGTRPRRHLQVVGGSAPPDAGEPATGLLRLSARRGGPGVDVVEVDGEIDLTTAPALNVTLGRLLLAPSPGSVVVLDLSGLEFCDVAGLNAILRWARALARRGARFAVAAPPPSFRKLLRATRLDGYLEILNPQRGHIAFRGAGDVPTLKLAGGASRAADGRPTGPRWPGPAPSPAA